MSTPASNEDLSPSEFVRKIRELGEKKDSEDAERLAMLEQDILKGREERAARRAERARSISPEKLSTPPPPESRKSPAPPPHASETNTMAESSNSSSRPLSRSGTLSWQQRPKSSGGRRPLSMLAAENAARSPRATPEPANEEAPELSRTQIAQSLASKDPTWFKQTADRGVGSAAYRRSQEDSTDGGAELGRFKMPGMSRESTAETEGTASPPPESARSASPSRASSIRMSETSSRYSNTTTTSEGGSMRMMSPPPSILDAPKLTPTTGADRKSPVTGRPPSPTKGMGGFVESAMLRRADSVSKRWSTQAPTGLSRGDSTASNRSSYTAGLGGPASPSRHNRSPTRADRPIESSNRGNSLEPGSRPSSSHSNLTVTQSVDDQSANTDRDGFVKPSLPIHSRAKSVASSSDFVQDGDRSGSISPSRRWSPTKSSWLESALTKTEDKPKAQPAPPPSQPSWMTELNKAKQHKSNPSLSESPPKLASPERFESPKLKSIDRFDSPKLTSPERFEPKSSPSRSTSPVLKNVQLFEPKSAAVDSTSKPSPPLVKAKSPPPEPAPRPSSLVKTKSPPPDPASRTPSFTKDKVELPLKAKSPSPVPSPTMKSSWEAKKPAAAPGKFDFRANLKSRQVANDGNSKEEPEFKNALGKLKRTQTEKFVAPDVLKDNILRGKADLTITGGPAPRVRKDEFKEDILKQKEVMKSKATEPKKPIEKPVENAPTPEALAKRQALHRSQSSRDSVTSPKVASSPTPEAIARLTSLKEKSKPTLPQKPASPPAKDLSRPSSITSSLAERSSVRAESGSVKSPEPKSAEVVKDEPQVKPFALPGMAKPKSSGKLADRFNPALASMLARGPPASSKGSESTPGASSSSEDPPKPSGPLEHKTKGRARGPKRRAPGKQDAEVSTPKIVAVAAAPSDSTIPVVDGASSLAKEDSPAPLVSKAKISTPQKSPSLSSTPTKIGPIANASLVRPKDVLPSSPKNPKISTQPLSNDFEVSPSKSTTTSAKTQPLTASMSVTTPAKPQSLAASKSPPLPRKPSFQTVELEKDSSEQAKSASEPTPQPTRDAWKGEEATVKGRDLPAVPTSSSRQPVLATPPSSIAQESPVAPETATPGVSVKNASALWGKQADIAPGPFSPGRPKSPVKLPTKRDEEKAMRDAGLMPPPIVPDQTKKPSGLGLGISAPSPSQGESSSKLEDRSPRKLPLSPPLSPGQSTQVKSVTLSRSGKPTEVPKLEGARSRPASASLKAPPESPIPHTSEANRLFTDFFDSRPVVAPQSEEIDTVAIIESYPLPSEKVSTISKQLQLVTGDGKLLPVPAHQEHILFDDSMYVCTHNFKTANGPKACEVYLWAGSGVPQAAVEDAQLFGRRVAKDNGGKLIVLYQGKETPNFFQAIGGILTTFRGSRSRSSSGIPSTFMLSGRKHLGHIAFDEVDLSPSSLCSGFPYLISSNSRLFLWKGKGCGAEELGCARLIAMDLSSNPDITEISDGTEPDSFFNLFPGSPSKVMPRSADHWRLKATNDKYRCRLFRVEQHNSRNSTLQVSSFFSTLTRRSSWSSLTSPRTPPPPPTLDTQPKTPTTPSPIGQTATTRIVEIAPFTQGDVETEGIYVLDAFFEVYVLIGPLAQSQSHAFATALLFAQDYGILAASLEDRPFVPVSTVVLEGVPRDMKPCFRQWSDEAFGFRKTEALMAGKPKRGGSLRCVGLAAALAATRT